MTSIASLPGYDELLSLEQKGTPPNAAIVKPKTRIKNATSVRSMFQKAAYSYERRHRKNAIVKGLVDGNPPWPNKTKDGQRYEANFNTGEAYSYFENATTAFYDIYSEPPTYATIDVEMDDPSAKIWGEKLTEHFDWLLRQDDAGDFNVQLSIGEMVLYGTGPQLFLRPLDWRSSSVPNRALYVADDAKANVADWEWCIFQFHYGVNELYDYIADEKFARDSGWDVAATKNSIMLAKSSNQTGAEWNTWETWQQALRDNSIYLGTYCKKVRVARMLFKEFSDDGAPCKITECWVDLDGTDDKYLMHREGVYDDMREAVCAFYYDRGDGTHQSIKGLGVKMYALLTTKMRLELKAVDTAFASTTVPVTSNLPTGRQSTSSINIGAFTVLPNGFSVQNVNLSMVLQPAMEMSAHMDNTLQTNLSQYRQRMELPTGNPPTKFQVQAQLAQQATLGKTQIARYYQQLDELYTEKYRRAENREIPKGTQNKWLKLALEFQKKCRDSGVPKEAYKHARVRATRIAGQGSPFMRQQALTQIFATQLGQLDEAGRENLSRDMISATVGPELVRRYWNREQPDPRVADQRWEAQVEHGLLFDSGSVQITPTQNDTIHLTEHFKFAQEGAASLQQGADPSTVFNTLVATRAHIAEHLQRLQQDASRKTEFDAFVEAFKHLDETINHLQAVLQEQAKRQQEAQAQAQMAAQGATAEQIQTQSKVQNDQIKTQSSIQTKEAKARQDMALKDARTAQDMTLKRAKFQQDSILEQASAQQELETQAIENATKLATATIEANKQQFPVR